MRSRSRLDDGRAGYPRDTALAVSYGYPATGWPHDDGVKYAANLLQQWGAQPRPTPDQRKMLHKIYEERTATSKVVATTVVASVPVDNGFADKVFAVWLEGWREHIAGPIEPFLTPNDVNRKLIAARMTEGHTLDALVMVAKSIWQESWRFDAAYCDAYMFGSAFKTHESVQKALAAGRARPVVPEYQVRHAPVQPTKVAPRPVYAPAKLGATAAEIAKTVAHGKAS